MPTLEIVNSESLKGGRRIMGIDPGTQVMGYGVVQEDAQRQLHLVVAGAVSLVKVGDPYQRLCEIYRTVQALTGRFSPGEVAIEAPFFGKNAQSMLKLGRAQGVAIAAIIGAGYPIFEYAPRRIKQAITGKGAATKEQVAYLLQQIFAGQPLEDLRYQDATDGLAVAVCHALQSSTPASGRGGSWETFARQNPDRVK